MTESETTAPETVMPLHLDSPFVCFVPRPPPLPLPSAQKHLNTQEVKCERFLLTQDKTVCLYIYIYIYNIATNGISFF